MTLKAALTAEEWKYARNVLKHGGTPSLAAVVVDEKEGIDPPHALAALCLHEQPFGFTRGDIRGLRYREQQAPAFWDDLIARISALLPPEDA